MESLADILKRVTEGGTFRSTSKDGGLYRTDEPGDAACSICKGAGWVRTGAPLGHPEFGQLHPCVCLQHQAQALRESRLQRYSNLGSLTAVTFESLSPAGSSPSQESEALWQNAIQAAEAFASQPQGWLVLTGPSGCGKTRLAAAIANRCLEQGQAPLFLVVPDFLDHLRTAYAPDSPISYDQLFERARNASILVLDGLGAHSTTPWAQEKLFQMLNHRFNGGLPTVVTLQGTLDNLEEELRTRLQAEWLSRVINLGVSPTHRTPLLREIGGLGEAMLSQMTFENFDLRGSVRANHVDLESLDAAYQAACNYARSTQGWLFFSGSIGCGKTHLSVAIINRRLREGQPCYFAYVPALLDHLRSAFNPESGLRHDELFDQVKNTPLLVLDDLRSETTTRWAEEKLFQIVAHRHNMRLPTVVNGPTMEELEETRPRIASRLKDILVVNWMTITGPDYRDQGSKRQPKKGRPTSTAR